MRERLELQQPKHHVQALARSCTLLQKSVCDVDVDVIALAGCFYLLLNTGERRKRSNSVGFSALQSIFHFSFFALFRRDYKREREIRCVQKEFTLEAGTGFSSWTPVSLRLMEIHSAHRTQFSGNWAIRRLNIKWRHSQQIYSKKKKNNEETKNIKTNN